jgi:phage shock protein PspC (stress-responsive transcriptional regulator)
MFKNNYFNFNLKVVRDFQVVLTVMKRCIFFP